MRTDNQVSKFHFRIDEIPCQKISLDNNVSVHFIGEILITLLQVINLTFKGDHIFVDGFSLKNNPSEIFSLQSINNL